MVFPPSSRRRFAGTWWGRHSLSIVLAVLMVVQTAHALWSGRRVWEAEQPGVDFWIWWTWEYNVSLVADTFGVLLIVILSKWLYEEGSSQG